MLAQVDQIIATNRNTHRYVTAARLIPDDLVIYDQEIIYVHAKMQYMSLFVCLVDMAYNILIDGLELACDDVDLGSAYDPCWADITVDKLADPSPHACDPGSTPGMRMLEVIKLVVD